LSILCLLTFAPRGAESEGVLLAALAVASGDSGLTLALTRRDVTLTVSGANRITVTPEDQRGRSQSEHSTQNT